MVQNGYTTGQSKQNRGLFLSKNYSMNNIAFLFADVAGETIFLNFKFIGLRVRENGCYNLEVNSFSVILENGIMNTIFISKKIMLKL